MHVITWRLGAWTWLEAPPCQRGGGPVSGRSSIVAAPPANGTPERLVGDIAMPTFDTPEPISATVDIILGDIRFKASDRVDTVIEVRPVDPSWELDVKAAEQADVEFIDGTLLVKHPTLRSAFTNRYGSVEMLVELPTGIGRTGRHREGRVPRRGHGRLVPAEDRCRRHPGREGRRRAARDH